jgi:hypothetical protein
MFRVPLLLNVSIAVIHRLNPSASKDLQPFSGQTSGYDPDFKEPIVFDDQPNVGSTPVRTTGRLELPAIRVPCQVEPINVERLRQTNVGDSPDSSLQLVVHRMNLVELKLIDPTTRELALKVNDRVSGIEQENRPGVYTQKFPGQGLFIQEIQPASFGFGPEGYDLHLILLAEREKAI